MYKISNKYFSTNVDVAEFVVPIFNSNEDRNSYTQIINSDGEVGGYEFAFESKHSEGAVLLSDNEYVNINSDPVFGYSLPGKGVFFGKRKDISIILEKYDSLLKEYRFSYIDVLMFLGRGESEVREAYERASERIGNAELRNRYLKFAEFDNNFESRGRSLKELLIRLYRSPNFSSTHLIISEINGYLDAFEPWHYRMAMNACLNNTQVNWIKDDRDVREFINFLLSSRIGQGMTEAKDILM